MSSSNLSTYYDAEEGDPTPPPPSPRPSSLPSPPPTFDSLPDATWNLEQVPATSPTLVPSSVSSVTAVSLPWEEDTSYAPPLSTTDWDIPSRQNHPQLDAMLTYVSTEEVPDYVALHFLAKCTPANDFTRLCSYLCMDGATQYLSGCIQSVNFKEPILEDLFLNLEWRLGSKMAKNDFYEACGKPPPFPPMQGALNKEFQQLNNEWTRRARQYGRWSTAKYFRRRDGSSALYLYLYHPELYVDVTQWAGDCSHIVPSPEDMIWAAYLVEDRSTVPTLDVEEA